MIELRIVLRLALYGWGIITSGIGADWLWRMREPILRLFAVLLLAWMLNALALLILLAVVTVEGAVDVEFRNTLMTGDALLIGGVPTALLMGLYSLSKKVREDMERDRRG